LQNQQVGQYFATGLWFSLGIPVSSTNKTDHRDITETLFEWFYRIITKKKKTTRKRFCNLYLSELWTKLIDDKREEENLNVYEINFQSIFFWLMYCPFDNIKKETNFSNVALYDVIDDVRALVSKTCTSSRTSAL
jgi:hypothetical protein